MEALGVLAAGLAVYFGSAYFLSFFCFVMSPIPLVVFLVYPTMKRFTPLAHFGVGLGLAMGPLGGWFAVSPSFDRHALPGTPLALHAALGRGVRYHLRDAG